MYTYTRYRVAPVQNITMYITDIVLVLVQDTMYDVLCTLYYVRGTLYIVRA